MIWFDWKKIDVVVWIELGVVVVLCECDLGDDVFFFDKDEVKEYVEVCVKDIDVL